MVLENHKVDGTDQSLTNSVDDEQTIVFTDMSTYYLNITDYVEIHMTKKSRKYTYNYT